jgi:hypothetical protein
MGLNSTAMLLGKNTLECSAVKVSQNKITQIKYRYMKNVRTVSKKKCFVTDFCCNWLPTYNVVCSVFVMSNHIVADCVINVTCVTFQLRILAVRRK